ncbi:vacuolar protein sorting-associated protein 53 homolog [Zophobas morio]|uniref:vacuolar protein sorting-associated protein 53 homolog n=1 Tax=Zophobas morio TaxID=2755281 RepID=UPI003082C4B8
MSSIPIIREGIDKESQKYLNNICLKLANTFISSYTNTLYQCQVSIPGAEQMLLDCHQIKQYLLKLHNIDFPENSVPIPSSYSKYISKVMNKLELSLKVLMSAETPVESFVINFIDLHPENDSLLFRKLLSMKGYSKSEEQILLDRFTSEIANSNSLKEEGKEENEIDCSVLKRLEDFIKNS